MKRTRLGRPLTWIRPKTRPHSALKLVRTAMSLPPKVDLSSRDTPIFDQGNLGSCTANAGCGLYDYLAKNLLKLIIVTAREFVYYDELAFDGNLGTDAGSSLDTCSRVFFKDGACKEELWPYDPDQIFVRPPIEAWNDASTRKIKERVSVPQDLDAIKQCLAEGYPVIFGMNLYNQFENAPNGVVRMPRCFERSIGGHALMIVGYDDENQWFIVRNSWGTDWGDKGYAKIPYKYLTNPKLADDFWTFRL